MKNKKVLEWKYRYGQVVETIDGIIGKIIGYDTPKVNRTSSMYEYLTVYKIETKEGIVFNVSENEILFAWFGVEI